MHLSEEKTPKGQTRKSSATSLKKYNLDILQPLEGYRFSVDALLLAEFARVKKRERLIELGAGCGVISMVLARRFPEASIMAVEIQEELFQLLEENVKNNHLKNISPHFLDMKALPNTERAGSFDHVISNPPFRRPEAGRLCLDSQEALARHEILINLSELLDISRYLLKPGGKLSLIYPAERSAELVFNMCKRRIEPKRLCFVHPDHARQARLVLIEGVKDAGSETRIEPPVFMNQ